MFFLCAILSGCLSAILYIILENSSVHWFLFYNKNDYLMDFFNPIAHVYDSNPYTSTDRIYPAFCYVLYWIISRIIPSSILNQANGFAIRECREGMFAFVLCTVVTTTAFTAALAKLHKGGKFEKVLLFIVVLFSAPFLHEYDRANIILLALTCLCLFFIWYPSENRFLHELSLLMLCIASCIKIYPAIFGLLLLRDRKWKDILHCLIYGTVLFFVPFLFMGGFRGFSAWIQSLGSGAANTLSVEQGVGYKVNFSNCVATLYAFFHNGAITEKIIQQGNTFALVLSVLLLIAVFFQRKEWKQIALLTGIMIGFPGFSFQYCMTLIIIPLVFFLKLRTRRIKDMLYAFLFAMMLTPALLPNGKLSFFQGQYPVTLSVLLEEFALLLMMIILIVDTMITFCLRGRRIQEVSGINGDSEIRKTEGPKVSICIPVYNGEETIRETVLSAVSQSYKNIEIVVIDNCSTDRTMKILKEMNYPNLIVYQNHENIGMVGNWNECLEHAGGKYINLLCADDVLEKECIEKKVQLMEMDNTIVMSFSASEVINENGEVLLRRNLFNTDGAVNGKDLALRSYYSRNLYGEPTNVMFRKSALRGAMYFDKNMCYATDWDMWLRLSVMGKVGYIHDVLMHYRISKKNTTSKTRLSSLIKDDFRLMRNIHGNRMYHMTFFDDCIHMGMNFIRICARVVFMKIKA